MNIFEVHRLTTSRIEPLHTVYMASCLKESPELLVQFWALVTAEDHDWPAPSVHARVVQEDVLDGGKRVDIVLSDSLSYCLIAVEAKTSDSSVEPGQLDAYLTRLETKYPGYRIWMTYLTPFNTKNKPKGSRGQEAIKEFQRFNESYSHCSHLSWEEITKLPYQGGGEVWRQHAEYILETICKPPPMTVGWGKLDDDLGWEILRDFWHQISEAGYESQNGMITMKTDNDPIALVSAIKFLITSEKVRKKSKGLRTVSEDVKVELTHSTFGQFHQKIFELLHEYPFLGIRGSVGYGLTLPVQGVHRVVSICTVRISNPERLAIGRPPRE